MAVPPKAGRTRKRSGCLITMAVIFGVGFVGSVASDLGGTKESALDKAEEERANGDLATLSVAQRVIRQAMKDPDSAEFSDGFGRIRHGQQVACGRVNGKNSFGVLARAQPWLVIVDQSVAMVESFDNQRTFVPLWNKYCTGLDDRDKPFPNEIFGIKFGSRPPAALRPYDEDRNVWIYRDNEPTEYLGVPITQVMFTVDRERITGVSIVAKGADVYDRLRDAIRQRYGMVSLAGDGERAILSWKWTKDDPHVQLSFNTNTSSVLLNVSMQEN